MTTLAKLIVKYDANGYFYADKGNGSAWGENGEMMDYDDAAAVKYGAVKMMPAQDGQVSGSGQKLEFISEWIAGENGYWYRIGF